jgi:hypothetical protein
MNLPIKTSPAIEQNIQTESIVADGALLAYIIRAGKSPSATTFLTRPDENLQVGFVVYPAGGAVPAHSHRPIQRTIMGTSEVVIVRNGRCAIDVYDKARRLVATRDLEAGDLVILLAGGHGFRMQEDTVLLEVKQGPYGGMDEKERFE